MITALLEQVTKRMWPLWTLNLDLSNPRAFSPLSLECTFHPWFPQPEPFSRTQPWKSNVLLRRSGQRLWLNPEKASVHTSKILIEGGTDLLVWWSPTTSFTGKSPCLVSLPSANPQWAASFLNPSLLSAGGQFMSQQSWAHWAGKTSAQSFIFAFLSNI